MQPRRGVMEMSKYDIPLEEDHDRRNPDVDLVAYLDGELAPGDRQQVEHRLASDPDYRARLRELQESWDLLDALPQAAENKSLTQSTVALATSEAAVSQGRVFFQGRQLKRLLAAVLTGLLGFSVVYFPLKWRADRRLRDLPVAQNIDVYRYAEDLEFLQALHDQGIFSSEQPDDF